MRCRVNRIQQIVQASSEGSVSQPPLGAKQGADSKVENAVENLAGFVLGSMFIIATTLLVTGLAPAIIGAYAIFFEKDWWLKFWGFILLLIGLGWMSSIGFGLFGDSWNTIQRMASHL
jgi:hypothetical protein